MRTDHWLNLVGKALILFSAGMQFFWLTPIQNEDEILHSLRLDLEFKTISAQITRLNFRFDELHSARELSAEGIEAINDLKSRLDNYVACLMSEDFRESLERTESATVKKISSRSHFLFVLFLLGSILVLLSEYLRCRIKSRFNRGPDIGRKLDSP